MAEIKKVLKDTLPPKLYLDTAFLIDVLIETKANQTRHAKAFEFTERLKTSKTTIICSKLSFIEYWSGVFKIKLQDVCGNTKLINIIGTKNENKVFEWAESQYEKLILFLETLTNRPDLKIKESVGILGMGRRVHDRARDTAIKYRLPIYDAIHYNTMIDTNTKHIITDNIDDFRHLKDICIWSYR